MASSPLPNLHCIATDASFAAAKRRDELRRKRPSVMTRPIIATILSSSLLFFWNHFNLTGRVFSHLDLDPTETTVRLILDAAPILLTAGCVAVLLTSFILQARGLRYRPHA
jgi:hypothetical protein